MKRIKFIIIIVIAVLTNTTACNELLDQMPSNSISGTSMWTTETQADMGVAGVYASLKAPVPGSSIVGDGNNLGYWGLDCIGMVSQSRIAVSNMFIYSVNPGNAWFSRMWSWSYTGIHRANNAISYIPDIPMDEKKKSRLIAESKVIRAYFYMILNLLYGNGGLGVPVYLDPVTPMEVNKGQTPESEVWTVIINDLTDAINEPELPNNQIGGEGRISKGAAYAFRGRAYLLSKDYDKAIADFVKVSECGYQLYPDYWLLFKEAQERCEEMVFSVQYIEEPTGFGDRYQQYAGMVQQGAKSGPYSWGDLEVTPALVNLYEVVVDANTVKPFNWSDFIPEWESVPIANNERRLFFIRDTLVNGSPIPALHTTAVRTQLNSMSASTRELYLPEGNEARLKAAYANRDPRLAYNVVTPFSNFLGVNQACTEEAWYTYRWPVYSLIFSNNDYTEPNLDPTLPDDFYPTGSSYRSSDTNLRYHYRKFVGEGLEFTYMTNNPIDEPIIRYADVLLMWAEALVEKNDLNGALAKVKEVRDRVGIPTMASSFSDQDKARNYVRDERRRELAGEGVNFFDEIRWRTLKETKFDTQFPQAVWGESTGGTIYQWIGEHYYTWPVPRSEIEMNPNLQRTPGWVY